MDSRNYSLLCNPASNLFNPLSTMFVHMSGILVISHFFLLALKRFGLVGPIAHILAGLVLGPSVLSQLSLVKRFLIQPSMKEYYQAFSFFARTLFMFLIGLETDVPYVLRNLRQVGTIAFAGILMCNIFGAAASLIMLNILAARNNHMTFTYVIMLVLSNTASPVVIRLAAELKYDTSDVGRLAIATSVVAEVLCIVVFGFCNTIKHKMKTVGNVISGALITAAAAVVNKYVAAWFNKRNRNQKYLTNTEFFTILAMMMITATLIEVAKNNSMVPVFLLGALFPRQGKTARTLLQKLTFAIHTFLLPIFFGYIGFQFNVNYFGDVQNVMMVMLMVLLSFGGKIGGTLAACHYLKFPLKQGVILSFFLSLKGNADLIFLLYAEVEIKWWTLRIQNLLMITIVLDTLIAGPVVAFLLSKDENFFANTHTMLESHSPEHELRIMGCAYGPRHVSATLALFSALGGSHHTPLCSYLLHLVELPKKRHTNLTYHQREDGEFSDEETYGGNDALEINDSVDAFTADTALLIRQLKNVSSFSSMFDDVCNIAEDLRVSMIILPFHKHQRIDGRMENSKVGVRTTNQKILRHAPCSVGIIIDRGFVLPPVHVGSEAAQHVAALFFNGPDDREALSFSIRIATHQQVNLTVIRFLPSAMKDSSGTVIRNPLVSENEVLMAISDQQTENDRDNAFLEVFYNNYVTAGHVGYVEKYVTDGNETVQSLKDMMDMYSLFIVGKGGRGNSTLTTGMSDWEECPELGTVGDVLASSEFNMTSSVLVIQQHSRMKERLSNDD